MEGEEVAGDSSAGSIAGDEANISACPEVRVVNACCHDVEG